MRLIHAFTQVDGPQPAASAGANFDATIAEEPEVEAAAEMEAEAVCVFGIYLQITAHHLMFDRLNIAFT